MCFSRLSGPLCRERSAASPKSTLRRYATLHIGFGVALPLTLLTTIMPAAAADNNADSGNGQSNAAESTAAQTTGASSVADAFSEQWKFQLGAGALNVPRYPGSRDDVNRGIPVVNI